MLRLCFRTCVWLWIHWHSYETTNLEGVTVRIKRLHDRFYISSTSRSVLAEWNATRGTACCIKCGKINNACCIKCGKINNLFIRCYQYGTFTVTTASFPYICDHNATAIVLYAQVYYEVQTRSGKIKGRYPPIRTHTQCSTTQPKSSY